MTFRSKVAKILLTGNPEWRHGRHLENLFFASSPELKGQLKLGRKQQSDL